MLTRQRGSGEAAGPGRHELARNRDFVRLWTSGAVSTLGSSTASLAYPLLALGITGSAAQAGLLALVGQGAGAVMRLPAGSLVDRLPLRRVLVMSDAVRAVTTAAAAASLLTGHLTMGQLLLLAAVNAVSSVFSDVAHSVALRHVVPAAQLPHAFALNEGRSHAIGLVGQPSGGFLYGVAPALPLIADALTYAASATLCATISHPLKDSTAATALPGPRVRHDVWSGLRFLFAEPFLRASLLSAAGYQLVFAGASFALIAGLTAQGASPASLGGMFAVGAGGGILGAVAAPSLQSWLAPHTLMVILGWVATAVFASLGWISYPLVAGTLLGCIFFTAAPANAMLSAVQINRTPRHLQGRVMAAAFLVSGIAAPLGPPTTGILLDTAGPVPTFLGVAALTAIITIAVHLSQPMRNARRPA